MEEDLRKALLEICGSLQRWDVQYMLVGGTAVALHGYYRHSMGPTGKIASKPDVDLWFDPSYANYFKLLDMLASIGCDVAEFKNEQQPDPRRSFFQLDLEQFTLDALPVISADIQFPEAYARKEVVEIDGISIPYIGFEDLLEDKRSSAREKDHQDVAQLKRIRGLG